GCAPGARSCQRRGGGSRSPPACALSMAARAGQFAHAVDAAGAAPLVVALLRRRDTGAELCDPRSLERGERRAAVPSRVRAALLLVVRKYRRRLPERRQTAPMAAYIGVCWLGTARAEATSPTSSFGEARCYCGSCRR